MAGACATETQLPSMHTMRSKAHDGPCALLISQCFCAPHPRMLRLVTGLLNCMYLPVRASSKSRGTGVRVWCRG